MLRSLRDHIGQLLAEDDAQGTVFEEGGRLFVESEHPNVAELLGRVFGLVSFSLVQETSAEPKDIAALAVRLAREVRTRGASFAVRARRVGNHLFTSTDVAKEVGAVILAQVPNLEVDLTAPDWEIHVEIRGEKAYLTTDILPGVGGLPLGTQGKVVALVETLEGTLASWLMMKRGCYVLPVFRGEDSWATLLGKWDPNIRWRPIESLGEMHDVAEEIGALGFVYPWTATQTPKEDLRPAFYPLMGFESERLADLRATVLRPG